MMIFPRDTQFGFWYTGAAGHGVDGHGLHAEQLHHRPGGGGGAAHLHQRKKDILYSKILEALYKIEMDKI